jgi:tripartite-type tricarboxylate transporter receptor subunit TctC
VQCLFISSLLTAFALLSITAAALAQEYPVKPIRMVVPLPPGGGTDIAARMTGKKLTERWGQQVIVDNRPGASGNIGTEIVAHAAPDGYTLLVTNPNPIALNQWVLPKLAFDPAQDLVPVTMLAPTYFVLITHPSVPANSVRELIELAHKAPGKLILASGGGLMADMFTHAAKVDVIAVQYKGAGQAILDVLGGQASMMFADVIAATPYVVAGRVKQLAISAPKRIRRLPEVPTLIESGVPFDAITWSGVFAPARTPAAIVNKLGAELRSILKLPDVQEKLASDGNDFGANTPQSLAVFVKSEAAKYQTAVKVVGNRMN